MDQKAPDTTGAGFAEPLKRSAIIDLVGPKFDFKGVAKKNLGPIPAGAFAFVSQRLMAQ